jgi:hypothetical protein
VPDLSQLFSGCLLHGQGVKHKLAGRTTECALEQISYQLFLGFFFGQSSSIDVGALGLVAGDEALFGHYLEDFENGGVSGWLSPMEFFEDVSDCAGTASPQDIQNGKLSICRSW